MRSHKAKSRTKINSDRSLAIAFLRSLQRIQIGIYRGPLMYESLLRAPGKTIFDIAGPGLNLLGPNSSHGVFNARIRSDEQRTVYSDHR